MRKIKGMTQIRIWREIIDGIYSSPKNIKIRLSANINPLIKKKIAVIKMYLNAKAYSLPTISLEYLKCLDIKGKID